MPKTPASYRRTWIPLLAVVLGVAVLAGGASALGGALTQSIPGCISETGTLGECADGTALDGAADVAISKDGLNAYAASTVSDAIVVFARNPRTGALTQLAGTAGCISETGSAGACTDGKALDGATGVVVAPDGKHVYVASFDSDAIAVFARDKMTGALTQLVGTDGCVSETGSGGDCADAKALDGAADVFVSLDGKHVYAASVVSDAVAVFSRNKNKGLLTQLAGTAGCVSETGTGGECADGKALDGVLEVASSNNGRNIYAASSNSDAVAVFSRDTGTGALTQLAGTAGCVSETGTGGQCADGLALNTANSLTVTPEGTHVYVASSSSDAVAVFSRDLLTGALTQLPGTDGCVSDSGTGGDCADVTALNGASDVAVSPDGQHVYVTAFDDGALAVFARNKNTGVLTQLAGTDGCVSETGNGGDCADGKGLDEPNAVVLNTEGKYVYVASSGSDAIAAFSRNPVTGVVTQLADCVSEDGDNGCADGKGLLGVAAVAVVAGQSVYTASPTADVIAVFGRDIVSGALTQLAGTDGCVSETGTSGDCADGTALDGVTAVAGSPDGYFVYAASSNSDAIAVFARDLGTGALTQLAGTAGCVSETGTGGACADGKALDGVRDVALSSDGLYLYAASLNSDAVAVFARNLLTGELTQLAGTDGCVSETGTGGACVDGKGLDGASAVTVTSNKHVYAASFNSDAVAIFARDKNTGVLAQLAGTDGCVSETGTGGACADGKGLDGATAVAVSAGKHLYAASSNSDAIAAFARNQNTGVLTQLVGTDGCVSETGSGGDCADGKALDGVRSLAASADGKQVYAASPNSSALDAFARAKTGVLTQLPGTAGCISDTGNGGDCFDGRALDTASALVVTSDGRYLYAASPGSNALTLFAR